MSYLRTPDVSVIVISHNDREGVLACLDSVRRFCGRLEVEAILVDNGSTDGTADAVSERFSEVAIVRLPRNEGVPARNHGLRRARGRYRMFLDSDAQLTEGALPTLVAVLDGSPRVGLVGPRLVYPNGALQLSTRRYPPLALPILRRPPLGRLFEQGRSVRHYLMADDHHDRRRRVEYVLGACQMFRAEAQRAVGEIDPKIWYGPDDADWCFRIREAGFEVLYVPEAEVIHEYRRISKSRQLSMLSLRFLVAHFYFQGKWWRHRHRLMAEGEEMDREARASGCAEGRHDRVPFVNPTDRR